LRDCPERELSKYSFVRHAFRWITVVRQLHSYNRGDYFELDRRVVGYFDFGLKIGAVAYLRYAKAH
jgi:hypothetical protein